MKACPSNEMERIRQINEISLKGEIVIFGSDYMAEFPFYELINRYQLECAVYNRSVSGLTLAGAEELLREYVLNLRPRKVFLAFGKESSESGQTVGQYQKLIRRIRAELPTAELFVLGLPGEENEAFNRRMAEFCDKNGITYIALSSDRGSAEASYRAQFKQLSRFFRRKPLTMADAFAVAGE